MDESPALPPANPFDLLDVLLLDVLGQELLTSVLPSPHLLDSLFEFQLI